MELQTNPKGPTNQKLLFTLRVLPQMASFLSLRSPSNALPPGQHAYLLQS